MLTRRTSLAVAAAVLGLLAVAPASGCSSSSPGSGANPGDGGSSSGSAPPTPNFNMGQGDSSIPRVTCTAGVGLQCKQGASCPNGGTTTIHGVVFDPAMQLPIYNVAVYVPNSEPLALTDGVQCGNCSSWYTDPIASAVTDANGTFTIKNAPSGANIPLIVQVGKWRMVYKLSNVNECADNDAAAIVGGKLHLPKNHVEGHIPNIAVSTGALDSLECLLMRMGVDKSEYTGDPAGAGRIHIFTGGNAPASQGGAQTQNPKSNLSYQYLWNSNTNMNQYDVVILSCEGNETSFLNDAGRSVLLDYTNAGGRVFASHYHYAWFNSGPFTMIPNAPPLATWSPEGVAGKPQTVGPGNDTAADMAQIVTKLPNGMPFPEGVALHDWLGNVGALTNDKLPIWYARHNADLSAANTASQGWITLDPSTTAPNGAEYFSFDTPVGSKEGCGRVVYSDLHVSGGKGAQNNSSVPPDYASSLALVPDGCASHPLTPQEKALEFMIFDLSSCLTPVGDHPKPPLPK